MSEWKEDLPEPLREAPFIGKADSLEDAVGKLAHAAQYMGTAVKLPSEGDDEAFDAFFEKIKEVPGLARMPAPDDEESYKAFMAKLGVPEEHTEYAIPEIDDFAWDENMAEDLRKYAKEAGLTKTQFDAFSRQIAQQEISASGATQQAKEEARKALRLDWGDTLESREALIRGWMKQSDAPEAMQQMLDDQSFPLETMNWLHTMANQFKGDVNPVSKDGQNPTPTITPEMARESIQEILNSDAYWNAGDPRHEDMKKKMIKMQGYANVAKREDAA